MLALREELSVLDRSELAEVRASLSPKPISMDTTSEPAA